MRLATVARSDAVAKARLARARAVSVGGGDFFCTCALWKVWWDWLVASL